MLSSAVSNEKQEHVVDTANRFRSATTVRKAIFPTCSFGGWRTSARLRVPISGCTTGFFSHLPVFCAVGWLLAALVSVSRPSIAAVFHTLVRFRQLERSGVVAETGHLYWGRESRSLAAFLPCATRMCHIFHTEICVRCPVQWEGAQAQVRSMVHAIDDKKGNNRVQED